MKYFKSIAIGAALAAIIFMFIPPPPSARANDQGISTRFYAFTNANFGPASANITTNAIGTNGTMQYFLDTNAFIPMTTGSYSNWYEYSIDKGRGITLSQVVAGTNANQTNWVTNVFDFSAFGSSNKTAAITGSNLNWLPYGPSNNYTCGPLTTINWYYVGTSTSILGITPSGSLVWAYQQPGANTNVISIQVPFGLIDNWRYMRWTYCEVTTNNGVAANYLGLTPPLVSEAP